jgi:hypothetical protein
VNSVHILQYDRDNELVMQACEAWYKDNKENYNFYNFNNYNKHGSFKVISYNYYIAETSILKKDFVQKQ